MSESPLHLFEATGVELEYMIVGRDDLCVLPAADRVIHAKVGSYESEIENGAIAWSNELALHVLEFKTNGPARDLRGLAELFDRNVREANRLLAPLGGRLLPSAAHPWMDPILEFRRWPHEYGDIYEAFHRIFDCSGHGWANLQSTHVNLPFSGDEEFGRLHAAIRVALPILPALAASSPVLEGALTGKMDSRLDLYRTNARRVPSVSGSVIPEPIFGIAEYQERVLGQIYRDLEPHDPAGTLRHDWVNARGCIPRFDRGSIEIRLLDSQECARAEIGVVAATVAVVKALATEQLCDSEAQRGVPTQPLSALLLDVIRDADATRIEDCAYLELMGWKHGPSATAGELWRDLVERVALPDPDIAGPLEGLGVILEQGCLARRISRRLGADFDRGALRRVYEDLARCLDEGTPYGVE